MLLLDNLLETLSHEELINLADTDCLNKGSIVLSKESLNFVITNVLGKNFDENLNSLLGIIISDSRQEEIESIIFDQFYEKTIFTPLLNTCSSNLFIITIKNNDFISYKYQII